MQKKPIIERLSDMLLYIDDKLDLQETDPYLHKEIMALLDEISENNREDLNEDWDYNDGY
jgi:hypothetical protein